MKSIPNTLQNKAVKNGIILMIAREFLRVRMEPSRILGMILQPLLFLLVFGIGFHESFFLKGHSEINYAAFFYPGILGLVVLFSSIYATLTLVDDKKSGFFRLMTISPAGITGALLGKILATTLLGFGQSLLFIPLLFLLPIEHFNFSIGALLLLLWLGSLCCSLIGVSLAWLSPSSSAFHALMSILLIPMWLLSGAMFPIEKSIFFWPSLLNPMTYLVDGLRASLFGLNLLAPFLLGLLACCVLCGMFLAMIVIKRPLR